MPGVTPEQIYTALLAAGASTTQAIGMLANGMAESGLDPEAVGDQGTSFGIWQQHGAGYSSLVTGNPQADMHAQVRVLAANGGFKAASGATGAEAAGNFSAGYERCQACQPGQASYSQRVANAAVVAGWVSSGKWPQSAGTASAATAAAVSGTGTDCAFGPDLPLVGTVCLMKKTTIRHFAGSMMMAAGGVITMGGVLLLAAFAFRASGAAAATVKYAGMVPGARPVARIAGRLT